MHTAAAGLLRTRLDELGVDLGFIRRHTERRRDDLKSALVPTREAACCPDASTTALRLLFCRETLSEADTVHALGAKLSETAWQCGLLHPDRPAPFHLRTAGGLYLLSDYLDTGAGAARADAVMGAGETTAILWQAARPRHGIDSALDLGCGAGTLALLLAAHARRVVGADINARAVSMARFNAGLNRIENAEFRAGDLYSPVDGERFDLIVSQPPYYPRRADTDLGDLTFLHGGERGDEIAQRVVAGVPGHLASSGRALVFSSWPSGAGALSLDGHDILALTTSRRELQGGEQSLVAIERGPGWTATRRLAPECWGDLTKRVLDRLLATERKLRGAGGAGRWRVPQGTRLLHEGSERFMEVPLFGLTQVDDQMWEAVQSATAGRGDSGLLMEAVRRGLLEWEPDEVSQNPGAERY